MKCSQYTIEQIQHQLEKYTIDGLLIWDFAGKNHNARALLQYRENIFLSRRFYMWVPRKGSPKIFIHAIEQHLASNLYGTIIPYTSWQSLDDHLKTILKDCTQIAIDYYPNAELPKLSHIDAGSFLYLQSFGIKLLPSWPIIEHLLVNLSETQVALHKEAMHVLQDALFKTQNYIHQKLQKKEPITEYALQQYILEIFQDNNCICDHPPICAFNAHSAIPHYETTVDSKNVLQDGSIVLIDLWCKKNVDFAPYADTASVFYVGKTIPHAVTTAYNAVYTAQQNVISFIQEKYANKRPIKGYEVDDIARNTLKSMGYINEFIHRTGHNIHTQVHGPGVNFDNFETHDTRIIHPTSCYSIEPGLYFPNKFGIRLECNIVFYGDNTIEVTGKNPKELMCIHYE